MLFNLLKKYNAKCVYIEDDKKKYASLLKTTEKNPNITPINTYIDVSQNKLDNILSKTFLKKNFDPLRHTAARFTYFVLGSLYLVQCPPVWYKSSTPGRP